MNNNVHAMPSIKPKRVSILKLLDQVIESYSALSAKLEETHLYMQEVFQEFDNRRKGEKNDNLSKVD